jgi:outer membrane protein
MKKTIFLTVTALIALAAPAQTTLSLDEVKSLAVKANMKTRSAAYATAEAQEQKKEAFTNYFPTLSASSTALKANHGMVKIETALGGQQMNMTLLDKMWAAGVTAVQPVFMGGQIVNGNKLAKTGVEASQLQENLSRNDVELTAENYYWQIVTLKEKEKTLETISTMLKSLEKDASLAVKAGVGLRNDLLQVQLKENEIESQKIKLDNGLSLCKMTLAQYIGMDGKSIDVSASADPSQLPGYPDSLKVDHEAAVANTNEYQLLQKNVDVKTLERKIEVGKNLPQVAVGASVYSIQTFSMPRTTSDLSLLRLVFLSVAGGVAVMPSNGRNSLSRKPASN